MTFLKVHRLRDDRSCLHSFWRWHINDLFALSFLSSKCSQVTRDVKIKRTRLLFIAYQLKIIKLLGSTGLDGRSQQHAKTIGWSPKRSVAAIAAEVDDRLAASTSSQYAMSSVLSSFAAEEAKNAGLTKSFSLSSSFLTPHLSTHSVTCRLHCHQLLRATRISQSWCHKAHNRRCSRVITPISNPIPFTINRRCKLHGQGTFKSSGHVAENGTTEEVKKIVTTLNEAEVPSEDVVEVVVSPPFVFLPVVKSLLRPDFQIAAQNCWVRKGGAFTGEVSAEMLLNLGIPWVILGHSERRAILNESNEFVGDKVAYALSLGLKVIACVGETLEQRESGSTMAVVAAQTKAIAERISNWPNVVVAYEPVWAIGTGKVATPAQAQEVHFELRKWLKDNVSDEVATSTRIIYGGSVNGANCKELAAKPDVDGFLVGGASLKAEFIDIIKSATVKKND